MRYNFCKRIYNTEDVPKAGMFSREHKAVTT
jgi:hypothetical protein